MTFYTFMMRNYLNEDSPAGALAQDMHCGNENFPRNRSCKFNGWYQLIRSHLEQKNACNNSLKIFDECWEEYVICEKKKLNKN